MIVESPTKARTIGPIVGDRFVVESSMGHIRDLPKSGMSVDNRNGLGYTAGVKPRHVPTYVAAAAVGMTAILAAAVCVIVANLCGHDGSVTLSGFTLIGGIAGWLLRGLFSSAP